MPAPFQVLSGLRFTLVAIAELAQSSREGQENNRKEEGGKEGGKSQEEIMN